MCTSKKLIGFDGSQSTRGMQCAAWIINTRRRSFLCWRDIRRKNAHGIKQLNTRRTNSRPDTVWARSIPRESVLLVLLVSRSARLDLMITTDQIFGNGFVNCRLFLFIPLFFLPAASAELIYTYTVSVHYVKGKSSSTRVNVTKFNQLVERKFSQKLKLYSKVSSVIHYAQKT